MKIQEIQAKKAKDLKQYMKIEDDQAFSSKNCHLKWPVDRRKTQLRRPLLLPPSDCPRSCFFVAAAAAFWREAEGEEEEAEGTGSWNGDDQVVWLGQEKAERSRRKMLREERPLFVQKAKAREKQNKGKESFC